MEGKPRVQSGGIGKQGLSCGSSVFCRMEEKHILSVIGLVALWFDGMEESSLPAWKGGSKPHQEESCRECQSWPAIMVLEMAPEEAVLCSTQPFG